MKIRSKDHKIYLDYAATTPVDKEVLSVMMPYFSEKYGNPGSLHKFGQDGIAAVDQARETIAKYICAEFHNVIFTGSATEANNLALRGVVRGYEKYQSNFAKHRPRIIISSIEHESILETAKDLEKNIEVEVVYLPVNKNSVVNLQKLKDVLNDRTILVSVMYGNNETGVIQPIKEISKIIREFKKENHYPLFHTDAVQAFQYCECDVNTLGVDYMTLSAHKICGPKGIGMLYIKNLENKKHKTENKGYSVFQSIVTGGGQEFGMRSGTENVPSIVGFAKVIELAEKNRTHETKRILELKNYFWKELKKIFPRAQTNPSVSSFEFSVSNSLSHILNVYFPGKNAEELLIDLDIRGVAVSSGAACSMRSQKPSHVLLAMGYSKERAQSSLRFSFGRFTTKIEIGKALKIIRAIF